MTLKQNEIKYLYIKSFKHVDGAHKLALLGHPKEGAVYRTIHNKVTGIYVILLEGTDGIIFDKLVNKEQNIEMIVLDRSNILSVKPSLQFIDILLDWYKKDEETKVKMEQLKKAEDEQEAIKKVVSKAIAKSTEHEEDALADFSKVLSSIFITNKELFAALYTISETAHNNDISQSQNREKIVYGVEGKGVNMLDGMEYIEDYLKSGNPAHVLGAIVSLTRELTRGHLNGLWGKV